MAAIGKTSIGATNDSSPGNYILGIGPYVAASSGTIDTISVYARAGTAGRKITAGIYTDVAGVPTSLIATSAEGTSISGGYTTMNVSGGPTITAGNSYWIAFTSDLGTLNLIGDNDAGSTPVTGYAVQAYSAGSMPATFPTSGYATQVNVITMQADYTVTAAGKKKMMLLGIG